LSAGAHERELDSLGCHRDHRNGGYHCHRGELAGQTFKSKAEAWQVLQPLQASAPPDHTRPILDVAAEKGSVIIGIASIIDGDTIEIHGRRIRLFGVDSPESRRLCSLNGRKYRCGQKAAFALSDFLGQHTVSCKQRTPTVTAVPSPSAQSTVRTSVPGW
jgi:hypothetical protein